MPDGPQQETTLLCFPYTTEKITGAECLAGMVPGIGILKFMGRNNIENDNKNGKN